MLLNINATRGFLFFTILNQKEFRIATVAMFACDLCAGVVPQMSPPPHDLERLRTTLVYFIVIFNRGRSVVSWTCTGRVFHPAQRPVERAPAKLFTMTRRVPVKGKSSVCQICMTYRIQMLIIVIFSLGKIL